MLLLFKVELRLLQNRLSEENKPLFKMSINLATDLPRYRIISFFIFAFWAIRVLLYVLLEGSRGRLGPDAVRGCLLRSFHGYSDARVALHADLGRTLPAAKHLLLRRSCGAFISLGDLADTVIDSVDLTHLFNLSLLEANEVLKLDHHGNKRLALHLVQVCTI